MPRLLSALTLLLPLLLAAVPARGAGPASPGETSSLALGCAAARAVDLASVCSELALFKHEGEARMGEELAQLLDAPARARVLSLLDAELKEKRASPGGACSPARPFCAFPEAALKAFRGGLAGEGP